MVMQAISTKKRGILPQKLLIGLLYVIMLFSISVPTFSYFSGFVSYLSVGSDPAEFTVGEDGALFTVGIGAEAPTPETPVSPIEAYIAAKPVLLLIPGLLLLCFVIWFWYMGFKDLRQEHVVQGLTYITIGFVLIGITLTIAMPLILDGVNSTMWFKEVA